MTPRYENLDKLSLPNRDGEINVMVGYVILSIIRTEIALFKMFDEHAGNRVSGRHDLLLLSDIWIASREE